MSEPVPDIVMDSEAAPLLSVEEAAARLGVAVRTLRDRLTRSEWSGRTVQVTRQTATGERSATMLPPSLVEALSAVFGKRQRQTDLGQANENEQSGNTAGTNVANSAGTVQQRGNRGAGVESSGAVAGGVGHAPSVAGVDVAVLLLAKDETIMVLRQHIDEQRVQLEQQREAMGRQDERLREALALVSREQEISARRMIAPVEPSSEPGTPDAKKNDGGLGEGHVRARMKAVLIG